MWRSTRPVHDFGIGGITRVIFGVVIAKFESDYYSSSQPSEPSPLFSSDAASSTAGLADAPALKLSEKSVTAVARLLLARMSKRFGGDCTLNELRVMNAVSVHSFSDGACSPTWLARETGIPKSTVSRSLASLVSKGWLIERKDTEDRRRRIIELSEKAKTQRSDDLEAVFDWIKESGH